MNPTVKKSIDLQVSQQQLKIHTGSTANFLTREAVLMGRESFAMGDLQTVSPYFNWQQSFKNSPVEIDTRLVMGESQGTNGETALQRDLAAESFVDKVGKEIRLEELQIVVCTSRRALVNIVPEVQGAIKAATLLVETVPEGAEIYVRTPGSRPLGNILSIRLMKRLEDLLITSTFTLAMLGTPKRRRRLAECIAAGHLTRMPANGRLKGVVEADITTATCAETNYVTGQVIRRRAV